jgi:hypothetical protein
MPGAPIAPAPRPAGAQLPEAHASRAFALFSWDGWRTPSALREAIRPTADVRARLRRAGAFQLGRVADAAQMFRRPPACEDYSALLRGAAFQAMGDSRRRRHQRAFEVARALETMDDRGRHDGRRSACRVGRGRSRGAPGGCRRSEDAGVRYNVACLYS